jgi:hypothetical protein
MPPPPTMPLSTSGRIRKRGASEILSQRPRRRYRCRQQPIGPSMRHAFTAGCVTRRQPICTPRTRRRPASPRSWALRGRR